MSEVKPMIITDNETGERYTLEFDKDSVRFAERNGFDIEDLGKYPLTKLEELFWYAFRKNHKRVDRIKSNKLLYGIGKLPENFTERLVMLYAEPFKGFADGEEDATPFVTVE